MKKLYDWTMKKAAHPQAERWLAGLSFLESSVFPVPTDIMLMPMILADRAKAWRYGIITTLASVLGAVFGYLIGAFLFESIGQSIVDFYGYQAQFEAFQNYYIEYGILIVLIGGLTPIPFKVITIASGVIAMNPLVFFLACIPARAIRFMLEAALLWKYGEPIKDFIERRLQWVMVAFVIVVASGFIALKFVR